MLHLFNKVYLQRSEFFINEKVGGILSDIAHSRNLDEPCSWLNRDFVQSQAEEQIRNLLTATEKRTIYCDPNPFAMVAALWYKSTTNMDILAWKTFIDCYLHREKINNKEIDGLRDLLLRAWDMVEPISIERVYSPSIELTIPSAMVGDKQAIDSLNTTFAIFMCREYEVIVNEFRRYLDHFILDEDVQNMIGSDGSKDLKTVYNLPFFEAFQKLNWNDSKDYELGNSDRKFRALGMDPSAIEDIDKVLVLGFKEESNINDMQLEYSRIKNYLPSAVTGALSDAETLKVLEEFKNTPYEIAFIPHDDMHMVNFVYLTYIKMLSRKGTEGLKPYTLR